MTKHPNKRSRKTRLTYLQVNTQFPLLALAANDLNKQDFPATVDSKVFAVWSKLVWSLRNNTVGEGPVEFGLAHSDYDAAEIEEWNENSTMWDAGDKVSQELRRRKCRCIGEFSGGEANIVANDEKPIFTKLMFVIQIGETLSLWARTDELLTTGAILSCKGIIAVRRAA